MPNHDTMFLPHHLPGVYDQSLFFVGNLRDSFERSDLCCSVRYLSLFHATSSSINPQHRECGIDQIQCHLISITIWILFGGYPFFKFLLSNDKLVEDVSWSFPDGSETSGPACEILRNHRFRRFLIAVPVQTKDL